MTCRSGWTDLLVTRRSPESHGNLSGPFSDDKSPGIWNGSPVRKLQREPEWLRKAWPAPVRWRRWRQMTWMSWMSCIMHCYSAKGKHCFLLPIFAPIFYADINDHMHSFRPSVFLGVWRYMWFTVWFTWKKSPHRQRKVPGDCNTVRPLGIKPWRHGTGLQGFFVRQYVQEIPKRWVISCYKLLNVGRFMDSLMTWQIAEKPLDSTKSQVHDSAWATCWTIGLSYLGVPGWLTCPTQTYQT